MPARSRRRRWPWIIAVIAVVLLVPIALVAVPILTHHSAGLSGQEDAAARWPTTVTASGDDGRVRTLAVASDPASSDEPLDTSALTVGQHLVVSGSGYDGSRGIYVAICRIPESASVKPGPCVGGVPDQEQSSVAKDAVQYAPSNWINDDWAWKLFGARSYDSIADGTFTAYLEVGATGDGLDCRVDACAIFTRNDHTAMNDRVQDLHLPIGFGN